jgi:cysteine-rich repeat protein
MGKSIGGATPARRTLRDGVLTAAFLIAALAAPGRAYGDVDLTGDWFFEPSLGVTGPMQVVQSGSTLTMFINLLPFTGTIFPPTGNFHVSRPSQLCPPGDDELSGTATPDGNSMSGSGGAWLRGFPSPGQPCVLVPFTFTAEYIGLCGNGVLDPGEACDDGNRVLFDCCSPTCQPAAAGTPCSDNNACTVSDQCDGSSTCVPGSAANCDDANVCTTDSCDPATGCVHTCNTGVTCGTLCGNTLHCTAGGGGSCTCQ